MEAKESLATRPTLAVMTGPPGDPAEYKRAGDELWTGLLYRYQQTATARDLELLQHPPHNPLQDREYQLALRRFDEYILEQTGVWGWRMDMSSEIVRVKARWESTNPGFLERYGQKQGLKSRTLRGEKSAPFLEGDEQFADDAILELKSLLRRQREEFGRRGTVPRCDHIAEWIRLEIESRPMDYPRLRAHLGQLHGYVANYLPIYNKKAAAMLESGGIRADSFFYGWYAAAHQRSVPAVRNEISRRRRQTQSSQK